MDYVDKILSDYQAALRKMGADPAPLALQAEALAALPDADLDAAFRAFHAAADRQTYVWDSDYGALLLEALGDRSSDPRRKARFYEQAGQRAAIFASYATSGGEGLARSIDVQRIEGKLKNLVEKQE